ncbi:hypothetical protein C6341_g7153 [Phytophthora cactorum]|nr:hypothetical protein C6341_g7153 [Phytophthora cactorum]
MEETSSSASGEAEEVLRVMFLSVGMREESQGLPVNVNTIREHLRLFAKAHRREERRLGSDQLELSEKKQLVRKYCKKLDEWEQHNRSRMSSQIVEFVRRIETNRIEIAMSSAESAKPRSREVMNTSVHASETTSVLCTPLVRSPPLTEEREVAEPASKRQKLGLETILERFLADQKERQHEQFEHQT